MSGLVIERVSVDRGQSRVVQLVDLQAPTGSVTVLLGANGAGKTTMLEAISGVLAVRSGRVVLEDQEITRVSRPCRSRAGLAHVEQGRTVFGGMTVDENLAAVVRGDASTSACFDLFPELVNRRSVKAGLLSGGEQQMLVIARALATRPKVLLIDELSLGLAPKVVSRLMAAMRELAEAGVGVLMVEQYASLALTVGERAYVMRGGRMVFDGACAELEGRQDALRGAYLGSGAPPLAKELS